MVQRTVPRLVFASTGALYADCSGRAAREDDPLDPPSHYAGSKATAEMLVRQAVADSAGKLHAVVLRFPHVYGPGNRKGVVWSFLDSAVAAGLILLDGEGRQTRDFLYVDDAVCALQAALAHTPPGVTTLNIGTGRTIPLAELARLMEETLQRPVVAKNSGRPEQLPHAIWLDPRRAAEALGWTAAVSLAEGLRRTAAWRLSLQQGAAPAPSD